MSRVLVTTDDGISAPGVTAVAVQLAEAGYEVVVAAAESDVGGSGTSIRCAANESSGIRQFDCAALEMNPGVHALRVVDAPPALIVLMSAAGCFGRIPDLVIAGVNHGPNVSTLVVHSGCFGAALAAANVGIPAAAVSLDDVHSVCEDNPGELRWGVAASVAESVADILRAAPAGTLINVNVPNWEPAAIRGAALATFAPPGVKLNAIVFPALGHSFRFEGLMDAQPPAGSDVDLLRRGFVTLTPVKLPNADIDHQPLGLLESVEAALLSVRLGK